MLFRSMKLAILTWTLHSDDNDDDDDDHDADDDEDDDAIVIENYCILLRICWFMFAYMFVHFSFFSEVVYPSLGRLSQPWLLS